MKDRYVYFNNNPLKETVGDCVVRALSVALDMDWQTTFINICLQGYIMCDMPDANHVWGEYLRHYGFRRHMTDGGCTVIEFCEEHPDGTYVLACDEHVVGVVDGCYFDAWNSGDEVVLYYWTKEEEENAFW